MKRSTDEVGEVPPAAVTVTSTVPADPPGEVATQVVVEEQETDVPALAPNATVVAPTTKLAPVMVTTVAPPTGPVLGLIPVTVGVTEKVWLATADGPPLFETVWPVKT